MMRLGTGLWRHGVARSRLAGLPATCSVRHVSDISSQIEKVSSPPPGLVEQVVDPSQIGYFHSVGLAQSWFSPSGIFERIFEATHVYTGMPWWATILAVTLVTRTLMMPLYLSSSSSGAKMARIKPELTALMERAQSATDQVDIQKAMLERRTLMKKHDIRMFDMAKPILSVPVFLGVFNALRAMSHVPVDGFTTGGLAWFTDLSAADPYCALQITTAVLYAATFKFFGGETGSAQVSPVMKKVMTYMPFIAVPLTMALPASVCFYFAINSVFSIVQSNILKSPRIRQLLKLAPNVTPEEQVLINKRLEAMGKKADTSDSIVGAFRRKVAEAKEKAEKRVAEQERHKTLEKLKKIERESQFVQFRK